MPHHSHCFSSRFYYRLSSPCEFLFRASKPSLWLSLPRVHCSITFRFSKTFNFLITFIQTYWWAHCWSSLRIYSWILRDLFRSNFNEKSLCEASFKNNLDVNNLSNFPNCPCFLKSSNVWLQIKSATSLNPIAFWITFKVLN